MAAEPLERAQDLAALEESLGAAADGRGRLVRAEAAWLEGRHREAIEATEAAFEPAGRRGMPMEIGELACWRRRAGAEEEIPRKAAEAVRAPARRRSGGSGEPVARDGLPLRERAGARGLRRRGRATPRSNRAPGHGRLSGGRDRRPAATRARSPRAAARSADRDSRQSRGAHSARGEGAGTGRQGASESRWRRPEPRQPWSPPAVRTLRASRRLPQRRSGFTWAAPVKAAASAASRTRPPPTTAASTPAEGPKLEAGARCSRTARSRAALIAGPHL
jgi:hypothetical protein